MQNNRLSVRQNTLWYTAGYLTYLVAQWLITVLAVRLGSYGDGGVLSLAISLSNFFFTVCTFGLRNFQVSDMKGRYPASTYLSTRLMTCAAGFLVCCGFVAVTPHNHNRTGLCIILYMLYRLTEAWVDGLAAEQQKAWHMERIAISFFVRAAASLGGFVGTMLLTKSLPAAITVMAALCMAAVLLLDVPYVKKLTGYRLRPSLRDSRPLFREALPLMLNAALLTVLAAIPRYALEYHHGEEVLGYYAAVATPAVIIQAGCNFIYSPLVAPMAEMWLAGDIGGMAKRVLRVGLLITAFLLAVIAGAAVLGRWGLQLIFGESILPHAWLLIPVLVTSWCMAMIYYLDVPLTVMRRQRSMTVVHGAAVALTAVLCAVLIPRMGMQGVNLVMYICAGGDALALAGLNIWYLRKAKENGGSRA